METFWIFWCAFLLYFSCISLTSGLELSFHSNSLGLAEQRSVCGSLHCEDETSTNTSNNHRAIISLSVFTQGVENNPQTRSLIALLTSQRLRVSEDIEGLRADGFLTEDQAVLDIELSHPKYCLAKFSCEVGYINEDGVMLSSSVGLGSQGLVTSETSRNETNCKSTRDDSLFLATVQELYEKLIGSPGLGKTPVDSVDTCVKDYHISTSKYREVYDTETEGTKSPPIPLLCETVSEGGGWLVFHKRSTGKTHFYRDWTAYKHGFGTLDSDFWLGNDYIHNLTKDGNYELRVELTYNGTTAYAHYDSFFIDDENQNYTLHLGEYDGTAGDSLTYHNGRAFSTYDRDNDDDDVRNCAAEYDGAWWYRSCHNSNLNAVWFEEEYHGPQWFTFTEDHPAEFTEMKIRKIDNK